MLDCIREGDEVRVWSVDRLGRSLQDLREILAKILGTKARLSFLSENLSSEPRKQDLFWMLQFQMLGAFAQFERATGERWRLESMAAARDANRYKKAGRKRAEFEVAEGVRLSQLGMSITGIAKALGAARSIVHKELRTSPALIA